MRLLHITDLHETGPGPSLSARWTQLGVSSGFDPPFDFAVVSGDLVSAAAPKDPVDAYGGVLEFLLTCIVPAVRDADRSRVILVPGNHDVAFTPDLQTTPVSDPSLKESVQEWTKLALRDPDAAYAKRPRWRLVLDTTNPPRVIEVPAGTMYERTRLAAFQRFYDDFYGGLAGRFHPFVLNGADLRRHWSAHPFEREEVVFYGLSSCHSSDEHWRGARISTEAISGAAARPVGKAHWLRVGVWHHGLVSGRGGIDFVSPGEVADALSRLKLDIVLHGHTHREEQRLWNEVAGSNIPVIATGSFAADSTHRPSGLKNQVSVVELRRDYAERTLWDYDEYYNRWKSSPAEAFDSRWSPAHRRRRGPHVEHHRRTVTVRPNGITSIAIDFQDCAFDRELVLACPIKPYHAISEEEQARCTRRGDNAPTLSRVEYSHRQSAYVLRSDDGIERWESIKWEYRTSGGSALHAGELAVGFGARRERWKALFDIGEQADVWHHQVEIPCAKLTLTLDYPSGALDRAYTLVVKPSRTGWVADTDEAARVSTRCAPNQATLEVTHPRVGWQYLLVYQLKAEAGMAPSAAEQDLGRRILERVERERHSTGCFVERIKSSIGQRGIAALVENEDDASSFDGVTWTLHLWDRVEKRLRTVCADGPLSVYASRFEYGEGIAGHAFRMRKPAVFVAGQAITDDSELIYDDGTEHEWVVSVPLLAAPSPQAWPIGTVSFSPVHDESPSAFGERLARLARRASMDEPAARSAVETLPDAAPIHPTPSAATELRDLAYHWSWAFWSAFRAEESPDPHDEIVEITARFREAWEPPDTEDTKH